MRIRALADAAGVSVDTVRYYEKQGLLPKPPRTPGGLRDYQPEAIAHLRAIRRAKALGFSLDEVGRLLALGAAPEATAAGVRALAARRLAETEAALAALTHQRDALADLVEACDGEQVARRDCPILVDLWGGS